MTDKERIIHALENCVACFVDDGGLCFPYYDDDRGLWHFSWNTNDGLKYSVNIDTENFENAEIINPSQGIIQVKDNNGYNTKIQILNGMEI